METPLALNARIATQTCLTEPTAAKTMLASNSVAGLFGFQLEAPFAKVRASVLMLPVLEPMYTM
ncbi:MAG: hypothetical protein A2W18_13295 [Candidatus Muproteobacteria bacterium RBG_16_60_9]|uniref:Uncharacterized protein n=1 Tax=Candidatus Muproteobacteria bacterium RBG_16_60_9 TaxID=1817755 RepID=A0A1F6VA69_9PROT|nr:MAG: hypothetical protein A2W18_13295 [Candidatus Muproteobacteria bacterium RBG_16_60_9]